MLGLSNVFYFRDKNKWNAHIVLSSQFSVDFVKSKIIVLPGKPVGDTVLYFGCRHRSEDYLYEDELDEYTKDGTLTHLHLAFSRDGKDKVYVQHLLKQNMEETWNMLEKGGHIYVCG